MHREEFIKKKIYKAKGKNINSTVINKKIASEDLALLFKISFCFSEYIIKFRQIIDLLF